MPSTLILHCAQAREAEEREREQQQERNVHPLHQFGRSVGGLVNHLKDKVAQGLHNVQNGGHQPKRLDAAPVLESDDAKDTMATNGISSSSTTDGDSMAVDGEKAISHPENSSGEEGQWTAALEKVPEAWESLPPEQKNIVRAVGAGKLSH